MRNAILRNDLKQGSLLQYKPIDNRARTATRFQDFLLVKESMHVNQDLFVRKKLDNYCHFMTVLCFAIMA